MGGHDQEGGHGGESLSGARGVWNERACGVGEEIRCVKCARCRREYAVCTAMGGGGRGGRRGQGGGGDAARVRA